MGMGTRLKAASSHRPQRRRRITNGWQCTKPRSPRTTHTAGDPSIAIKPGGEIKPDRKGISLGKGALPSGARRPRDRACHYI